jgi:GNAT superfamily N-acetyltransferase
MVAYGDAGPAARGAAILDPGSRDEGGGLMGWIGYFEALEDAAPAVAELLRGLESVLARNGAHTVIAPRSGELLQGLQVSGFDLPQTVFTPHNPGYYRQYFLDAGYARKTGMKALLFDKGTLEMFHKKRPGGIRIQEFDRTQLDREIRDFNRLNNAVFGSNFGQITRSLDQDRQLIGSFLPWIMDELVLFARDGGGSAVGFLVCVPDLNQMLKEGRLDRARIITIGVLPGMERMGIGTALVGRLIENLTTRGFTALEASWILEDNVSPLRLAEHFNPGSGREFELFFKRL